MRIGFAIVLIFGSVLFSFAQDANSSAPDASAPDSSPSSSADQPGNPSLVPSEAQPPSASVQEGVSTTSLDDVGGASAVNLGEVSFDDASVSVAGPDAIYLRGVVFKGAKVSLLFKQDDAGVWKLESVTPEEKNYFPSSVVFDFAKLSKLDNGNLEIDGIVLDGKPYKTEVTMNPDNSLSFAQPLQAGSFVGSSLVRAKGSAELALKDELDQDDSVKAQLDQAQTLNKDMLAKIGDLEASGKALDQDKQNLNSQIKDLNDRNTALGTEVDSLKKEIADLKSSGNSGQTTGDTNPAMGNTTPAASTNADLESIAAALDALSKKVDSLDQKLAQVGNGGTVASGDVAGLQAQIKTLSDQNETLMRERQGLEEKIRSEFIASGYIQTIKPLLTKTVLTGFSTANSKIGSWKVSAAKASQIDPSQYFAQLNLPLVQNSQTMLYRFDAKSSGKGWVGLGLHIYAQDSPKKGYGHGQSLLVWLTRDPDYYKNNRTYLQLYRSDNDVAMGRVLDSAIQDSIGDNMTVEVLYQPKDEYITVSINGVEKIRYKTWFNINQGVEVALRSLGPADFSNLSVSTGN